MVQGVVLYSHNDNNYAILAARLHNYCASGFQDHHGRSSGNMIPEPLANIDEQHYNWTDQGQAYFDNYLLMYSVYKYQNF